MPALDTDQSCQLHSGPRGGGGCGEKGPERRRFTHIHRVPSRAAFCDTANGRFLWLLRVALLTSLPGGLEWSGEFLLPAMVSNKGCSIEQELAVHHLGGELNLQMWAGRGWGEHHPIPSHHTLSLPPLGVFQIPMEKTLLLGKIEGWRRRGQERMRWLDGITDSVEFEQTLGDSKGQGSLVCCTPWGHKELATTEQQQQSLKSSH